MKHHVMREYKIMWQRSDGTIKEPADNTLQKKVYLNRELLQQYVDGLNYAYCNCESAKYIVMEI